MVEERYYDDTGYHRVDNEYVVKRNSGLGNLLLALLFIPVAFFAGWIANGYLNTGTTLPGLQVGVGGGPDNNVRPTAPRVTPVVTVAPTITTTPSVTPFGPTNPSSK